MLYLCGDAYTAPAVFVKNANTTSWKLYFIGRDYLGSITHILTEQGVVQQELSYDAWGRLRDPQTLQVYARGSEPELFLGRGYTGHEHLSPCGGVGGGFGLINMNARLYDPLLGRFLSPDPYIQDPYNPHNYNRYAYCLNNPFKYTDPNGENPLLIAAGIYVLFFTDFGYDFQKLVSPVALKIDLRLGSNQLALGYDFSYGVPQAFPISYRKHYGQTYFWKNEDLMGNDMSGWETRKGGEWGISGYMFGVPLALTYSGTTFESEWSGKQTTNLFMLGNPLINLKYENDMDLGFNMPGVPRGDGDKYRTAAFQLNVGPFGIGTNMITGDAGPDRFNTGKDIDGHTTYAPNNGYDPDTYRQGIIYFRVGPFRIGWNSEGNRRELQNKFVHDWLLGGSSYWFQVLNLKPKFYWQFGYSGGGTLW